MPIRNCNNYKEPKTIALKKIATIFYKMNQKKQAYYYSLLFSIQIIPNNLIDYDFLCFDLIITKYFYKIHTTSYH